MCILLVRCRELVIEIARNVEATAIPSSGLDKAWGFQEDESPKFQDNRYMKVARLSAQSSGRLYPPANIHGNHLC